MIGLAWQRRVRIAAMRHPSHKFTPKRQAAARANQRGKCKDVMSLSPEKTIVLAILGGSGPASNGGRPAKRKPAHQLNRKTTPFHSR
jgi:hypothetical protein